MSYYRNLACDSNCSQWLETFSFYKSLHAYSLKRKLDFQDR